MNETVEALYNIILDMFKEYPHEWVASAYLKAYGQALTHHVEIDSCGKPIWVRNLHDKEICRTCGTPKGETDD